MNLQQLKTELICDEGIILSARPCSEGFLSIGAGRNLDGNPLTAEEIRYVGHDGRTKPISRGAAAYLLDNDIKTTMRQLDRALPWWSTVDEVRRRALVNMGFNLGVQRLLGFKKMLAALTTGDYEAAAREALDSKWARQVKSRSARVAHMLRYGVPAPSGSREL